MNEIAQAIDVKPRQIYSIMKRQDIKDKIRLMESKIVETYEPAVQNIITVVNKVKDIPDNTENKGLLQIRTEGMAMSRRIAESIGLLPSNSMAPSVTNIYNDHRQQLISPLVDRLVTGALEHKVSDQNTLDVVSSEEIEE